MYSRRKKAKYTDKQKLAYYKRLAANKSYVKGRGRTTYPSKRATRKPTRSTLGTIAGAGGKALISGALGQVGRTIGTAMGGAPIGTAVGGVIGSALGQVGDWVSNAVSTIGSKIMGFGEYQIKENVFLHGGNSDMPPIVNPDPGGGFLIRRCEYLGDVISSSSANTFQVQNYFLNPGQATTFPWLSQIAQNFEEWVCEGMYFEFRSMSADALNSTNTALGQVIMATNYNALNANFSSKQTMENYEGGISSKPSKNMMFFVECARNQTVLDDLYVRPGPTPAGQDQRFYDLGNFQIATNGMQGTSVNLGELWVCYQISLRKPKMYTALGFGNLIHDNTRTGCSSASPLGTTSSLNTNVANFTVGYTGTTMVLPLFGVGVSFIGFWKWSNSSVTSTVPAITFGAAFTPFSIASSPNDGNTGITEETIIKTFYLAPNYSAAADRTITFGGAGTISVASCRVNLNQVSNGFTGFLD